MNTAEEIRGLAVKARAAAALMRSVPAEKKNAALTAIADALEAMKGEIIAANAEDVAAAWECVKDAKHPRLQIELPISTVQME